MQGTPINPFCRKAERAKFCINFTSFAESLSELKESPTGMWSDTGRKVPEARILRSETLLEMTDDLRAAIEADCRKHAHLRKD